MTKRPLEAALAKAPAPRRSEIKRRVVREGLDAPIVADALRVQQKLHDQIAAAMKRGPYLAGARYSFADGAKQSVCVAAIELAHGFGLTVCAKGVDNVEDLRTLIDLGCHSVQGFLFAKPMDSLSFVRMLLGHSAGSKPQNGNPRGDASSL